MNRIFPRFQPATVIPRQDSFALMQYERRQRQVADALLRDVAYALHLTRRVKAELRQERALYEAAMA